MTYKIHDTEYEAIRTILHQHTGITLGLNKHDFLLNRLSARLEKINCNFSQYIQIIKNDQKEMIAFINSLTTNKTDFFREDRHFDRLKEVCLERHKHDTVYIWSAACSNGSEVYTIAILLDQLGINYRVLGTDIDTKMLTYADKGIYSENDLGNLPPQYLENYFEKRQGQYKIIDKIKKKVKFKKLNLMNVVKLPLSFHFVFLRNVLIYFEGESHAKAIDNVYNNLKRDGILFIGHSESLEHRSNDFNSLDGSSFLKK